MGDTALIKKDMEAIDLSPRAKFRLSGADRVRYLNGQVSNDVGKATEAAAISACVTTVKGRLQGLVWITVEAGGEAFLIDTDSELRELLMARLGKYIIADDVELEDVSDEYSLLHVIGADGEGVASERFATPGRDLWLRRGAELPALDRMGTEEIERFRVAQGVPAWGAELTVETLPAEALLDRRSVDFHKGCYVGQEVISRVESVGRVNRTLAALVFEGSEVKPGWQLTDAEGAAAGVVTSVVLAADGSFLGLAFLKRDAVPVAANGAEENMLSCTVEIRDSPFTTQT